MIKLKEKELIEIIYDLEIEINKLENKLMRLEQRISKIEEK